MPKISLLTFGCKLNQAEIEEIKQKLNNKSWEIVSPRERADVCLINSCAVTEKAERKVRQAVYQIKKRAPQSILVLMGCYVNKAKNQKIDFFVKDRSSVLGFIKKLGTRFGNAEEKKNSVDHKIRHLVRIQSGCRNFCSYCIVPFLRKKMVSRSSGEIVKEIKKIEKQNEQEAILVGTNISLYLDTKAKVDFIGLIKLILKKTSLKRIRLSSFWPTFFTDELIYLLKTEPRICPHLHLSIQSASDKILKRMNRGYNHELLKKVVEKLRQIPNINLTADFIVGFPGETENDFLQTYNFIKWAKFLKIHVFRFSPRPFTKAIKFKNQISEQVKKQRSKKIIELGKKIAWVEKTKVLGKKFPILIEGRKNGYWQGFTPNYLRVFIKENKKSSIRVKKNEIIETKMVKPFKDGVIGQIIDIKK